MFFSFEFDVHILRFSLAYNESKFTYLSCSAQKICGLEVARLREGSDNWVLCV